MLLLLAPMMWCEPCRSTPESPEVTAKRSPKKTRRTTARPSPTKRTVGLAWCRAEVDSSVTVAAKPASLTEETLASRRREFWHPLGSACRFRFAPTPRSMYTLTFRYRPEQLPEGYGTKTLALVKFPARAYRRVVEPLSVSFGRVDTAKRTVSVLTSGVGGIWQVFAVPMAAYGDVRVGPQGPNHRRFCGRQIGDQQRFIDCRDPKVHDLSPLRGLKMVSSIRLERVDATDLSPLAALTTLTRLSITRQPKLADLTPLAGLTKLQHLDLRQTRVRDLTPLRGLLGLESLTVSDAPLEDLSPLAKLRRLTFLDLSNTAVSRLSPLGGMVALEELLLRDTKVKDLGPISRLPLLESLLVEGAPVKSLRPLRRAAVLRTLCANKTKRWREEQRLLERTFRGLRVMFSPKGSLCKAPLYRQFHMSGRLRRRL